MASALNNPVDSAEVIYAVNHFWSCMWEPGGARCVLALQIAQRSPRLLTTLVLSLLVRKQVIYLLL